MKHSANHSSSRRRAAFTLIEVLVVLVIVMGLASIVTVNVVRHQAESRVKTAQLQINQLVQALQSYHLDHGRYPSQAQGLEALVARPTSPPVPATYPESGYLARTRLPLDPWGNPYVYLVPGRSGEAFELISYGSDGGPGGEGTGADISSADL
jgi:general secretion pathway protein G